MQYGLRCSDGKGKTGQYDGCVGLGLRRELIINQCCCRRISFLLFGFSLRRICKRSCGNQLKITNTGGCAGSRYPLAFRGPNSSSDGVPSLYLSRRIPRDAEVATMSLFFFFFFLRDRLIRKRTVDPLASLIDLPWLCQGRGPTFLLVLYLYRVLGYLVSSWLFSPAQYRHCGYRLRPERHCAAAQPTPP